MIAVTISPGRQKLTPEGVQALADLLPTARSFRDLQALFGVSAKTLRKVAEPFLALMKAQGTHPVCGCGKLRFHARACVALNKEKWEATPGVIAKRELVTALLRDGHSYRLIGTIVGLSSRQVREYRAWLSPEELAARQQVDASRRTYTKPAVNGEQHDG